MRRTLLFSLTTLTGLTLAVAALAESDQEVAARKVASNFETDTGAELSLLERAG